MSLPSNYNFKGIAAKASFAPAHATLTTRTKHRHSDVNGAVVMP